MAQSHCRSCRAPIRWVVVEPRRKLIPIETQPDPTGNMVSTGWDSPRVEVMRVLKKDEEHDGPRYLSHFSICPDGPDWRRK